MASPQDLLDVDVAVIGAGWYGLVAAKTYLRFRPAARLIILDSDDTIGGVWSKGRLYPNLVAQVKLGAALQYSDAPMAPNDMNRNDPIVTGEMIHRYLREYAELHDLMRHIRFNTFVVGATKCESGWQLRFRDSDDILKASKLLVATGVTSIPKMPQCLDDDGSVPLIHSRDLGQSFDALKSGSVQHVVVTRAAKSAYDVVFLMLSMGKQVTWVIRTQGAGPLAILPFMILGLVNSIGFASTRLMSNLSPSILNTSGWLYWLLQRTILGQWIVGLFWHFLDYISSANAGYNVGGHVAALKSEIGRQSVFWAHSGLGVVTLPNFWETLHSKNLTIARDEIDSIKQGKVLLKSRTDISADYADYAVFCTRWGDHFTMFDKEYKSQLGLPSYSGDYTNDLEKKGAVDWEHFDRIAGSIVDQKLPLLTSPPELKFKVDLSARRQNQFRLYKRVVPVDLALKGDTSVAILGQIHTVQTPLVSEIQSLWAVAYLLGEVELPSAEMMASEVSLWNAWTRKRYLNQGVKFPYSLYDFLPYIDSLFEDLGLSSRRKHNYILEILGQYSAQDFNGFLDEYLEKRGYYV